MSNPWREAEFRVQVRSGREGDGAITVALEALREHVETPGRRLAVVDAVTQSVEPGEHGGVGRQGPGRGSHDVLEDDAPRLSELRKLGGRLSRVPVDRQPIGSQRVHRDQNHVHRRLAATAYENLRAGPDGGPLATATHGSSLLVSIRNRMRRPAN